MSARRPGYWVLLVTYPLAWRDRYGEELLAMVEDQLDGGRSGPRMRAGLALAGLRERGRVLLGSGRPPGDQVRSGYTLVLAAWAAFVAAGASYAKLAEHFGPALAGRAGAGLASAAYDAVVVLALAAAVAVLAGAVLARRAFARFLRRGGWALIRRRVAAAAAATVLAAGALAGLAGWAHSLTAAQRNGQSAGYSAAFVAVAAAAALALGLWASAGVTVGRHLDLRPRLLTAETVLARAAAALMTLITVAVAVWWAVVATAAPWYLWGSPAGTASSPFDPNLVGTMLVMLAATTLALYGARQAARSRRDLRRLSTGH